ncbi:MAG: hypothetical protein KDI05_06145 [Halieaceae bacterium]|nr:hypothetical protein [Halieaceae bacterium]
MRILLLMLLVLVPGLAAGDDLVGEGEELADEAVEGWQGDLPASPSPSEENWVDDSHAYATEQADALTQWMDDYFGDPNYELEAAESFLRLDFITDWDQDDGNNNQIRLRGKLQLPKVSRRLNLVFNDESGDEFDADPDARKLDDNVGLVYEVAEDKRSRFDLTMGLNWNRVRPGVRYRFQDTFAEFYSYRLTQRVQWENGEGFYATSQAELNRALGENSLLRWNNRAVYGEETRGAEWVSRLSLFERRRGGSKKYKTGINYFAGVNGFTDPRYIKNYRVGVLFRRQIYRKFLFLEVEPAYNYRKENEDDKRHFAWSIGLTLQVALERDLARKKNPGRHKDPADDNISGNGPASPEDAVSQRQPTADSPYPDLPL